MYLRFESVRSRKPHLFSWAQPPQPSTCHWTGWTDESTSWKRCGIDDELSQRTYFNGTHFGGIKLDAKMFKCMAMFCYNHALFGLVIQWPPQFNKFHTTWIPGNIMKVVSWNSKVWPFDANVHSVPAEGSKLAPLFSSQVAKTHWNTSTSKNLIPIWLVVSNIFFSTPTFGKTNPSLTSIFFGWVGSTTD